MDYGVHLPQIGFDDTTWTLERLADYAATAERLGYAAISANDHLVFPRPWIDGPTALAAVLHRTGRMTVATTIAIPIVRGPVAAAKTLGALDLLSGGRLVVGVGPGSSQRDYEAVGVPWEERWKRLDEVVQAMRALWTGGTYSGRFYSTEGVALEPRPVQQPPPVWIGSWGSEAGLRRVARLADGWLASAYNTTPPVFAEGWAALQDLLRERGKDPATFPNGLATTFLYVTEDASEVDRVFARLTKAITRPEEELRERLLIGPAEACIEKLRAYRDAGLQRVFLWPVADEERQLETFMERVAPEV